MIEITTAISTMDDREREILLGELLADENH